MRIAIFVASLGSGGAEKVAITLANAFRQHYPTTLVINSTAGSAYGGLLDSDVARVDLKASRARFAVLRTIRWLWSHRPDVALVMSAENLPAVVCGSRLFSRTTAVVFRSNTLFSLSGNYSRRLHGRLYIRHMMGLVLRMVDHVISQSSSMKQDLKMFFRLDPKMITTIHNPVAEHFFQLTRAPDKNMALFVGRLDECKDVPLLLRAFHCVHEADPRKRLLVVGTGRARAEVASMVRELDMTAYVSLEGFQADVDRYYARAALAVLTSKSEGFPNSVIEAIASGVPVVSVDCPSGPAEIIERGRNGYLVDSRDPIVIAAYILKAFNRNWDPNVVRETANKYRVGRISRQYVATMHSVTMSARSARPPAIRASRTRRQSRGR